jgi:exosortase A-associated hydrolase 2
MTERFHPLFLTVDSEPLGQRFAIHHPPLAEVARGLVVYVHPFAEEMNKSRRMAAQQSRALAAAGFAVLQIDLLGCGDSAGDFGDASWARWVDDAVAAVCWLRARHATTEVGQPLPLWFWGLRAGTLLAAEAGTRLGAERVQCNFLFWQPAPQGRLLLQQFLRLKAAGELLAGQAKAAMRQLRGELAAGRPVEIGGYSLAAALCNGMELSTLVPPAGMPAGRVVWLEVSAVETSTLAPAGAAAMAAWREAGWAVQAQALRGPAFWQTTEIEDAPALIEATTAALNAAIDADAKAADRNPAAEAAAA